MTTEMHHLLGCTQCRGLSYVCNLLCKAECILCNVGMRTVDAEYKLEKNIKIAMLYLEDDDAISAETFIKKAASLITGTKVTCL